MAEQETSLACLLAGMLRGQDAWEAFCDRYLEALDAMTPKPQTDGQYGNARCTVRNLKVVKIDTENNLLVVRGAVPGPNGGFVMIRETNKL